jgi:hypothetical protein
MDDKFYEQFKSNLENRPEPAYDGQLWRQLEKDLDREQDQKPKGIAWWWVAALLLPLLGSNLFVFCKFQETEKQLNNLIIKADTIFQTTHIYHTDTIYQTTEVTQKIIRYLPTPQTAVVANNNFSSKARFKNPFTNQPLRSSTLLNDLIRPKTGLGLNQQIKNSSSALLADRNIELLPYSLLELLSIESNNLKPNETKLELKNQKKTLVQKIYGMRPKGFALGLEGGLARPVGDSFNKSEGYTVGINAQIRFSPKLRMWANTAYINTNFESSKMGEDIGIPVVNPPSDDFEFDIADVGQPILQYSVGMQYLWNATKKWKPFVGVGYGAVSLLPYEITYDFENENAGFEWSFEETINQRTLVTDFLLLQVGLEYELNENWYCQLKTGFSTNLKNSGIQSPQLVNLTTGLGYNF